jgi:hypothetical protein
MGGGEGVNMNRLYINHIQHGRFNKLEKYTLRWIIFYGLGWVSIIVQKRREDCGGNN